jgi:hypothetical protein
MGVNMYIRSLTRAATRTYAPRYRAACRRRDAYFSARLSELLETGMNRGEAELRVRQEGEAQRRQAALAAVWLDWYSPRHGYFRDGYNETNLFSLFGLADYRLFQAQAWNAGTRAAARQGMLERLEDLANFEVLEALLGAGGLMQPAGTARLLEMLEERKPVFEWYLERLGEYWPVAFGRELNAVEAADWVVYFRAKYGDLKEFLQLALELRETIYVSC